MTIAEVCLRRGPNALGGVSVLVFVTVFAARGKRQLE